MGGIQTRQQAIALGRQLSALRPPLTAAERQVIGQALAEAVIGGMPPEWVPLILAGASVQLSFFATLTRFIGLLTRAETWLRIGLFVVGALLLLIGIKQFASVLGVSFPSLPGVPGL